MMNVKEYCNIKIYSRLNGISVKGVVFMYNIHPTNDFLSFSQYKINILSEAFSTMARNFTILYKIDVHGGTFCYTYKRYILFIYFVFRFKNNVQCYYFLPSMTLN